MRGRQSDEIVPENLAGCSHNARSQYPAGRGKMVGSRRNEGRVDVLPSTSSLPFFHTAIISASSSSTAARSICNSRDVTLAVRYQRAALGAASQIAGHVRRAFFLSIHNPIQHNEYHTHDRRTSESDRGMLNSHIARDRAAVAYSSATSPSLSGIPTAATAASNLHTGHHSHSHVTPPAREAIRDIEDHFEDGENVIAGAISGLIAETVMHPFDTVSHRAKVHPSSAYGNFAGAFRLIYRQEGFRGYFAGVSATIAQSPPANAAYFFTYETLKRLGLKTTGGEYESAVFFIAGGLSELASSLCFVPFDVVKSRLQLGENPHRATGGLVSQTTNYRSLGGAITGLYRERGIRGLTSGWGAGLFLDMSFSGTQFLLYEQLKRFVRRQRRRELTSPETLVCGCISGGLAAGLTNPLDVVASRMQCQDANRRYGANFYQVLRATLAEGRIALWRGTLPRVAQIAPLSALSFAVYEAMRRHLKDTALFRGGQGET